MVQPELLGVAAALMLLGAVISLCVKCQLSATKREMQLREHRSQKATEKKLSASPRSGYGSRNESRYQNFLTEDYLQENSIYVEPISLDYNNGARFFTRPQEKEEDSYSYENVIIGVSHGSDLVTDEAADYENSAAIHTWRLQQEEGIILWEQD
ncbi:linker for activation of T-cells family member 2 [Willisornis vidua]|uniref:Linker for activation of T-cells family member 2 n=1 Tax=Willisornis vidua TaxID=1566151 RepID=A0ABQ9CZ42_9PASS|nr:linker for activation of T-cells family member 2 [Willisornis vidua]